MIVSPPLHNRKVKNQCFYAPSNVHFLLCSNPLPLRVNAPPPKSPTWAPGNYTSCWQFALLAVVSYIGALTCFRLYTRAQLAPNPRSLKRSVRSSTNLETTHCIQDTELSKFSCGLVE